MEPLYKDENWLIEQYWGFDLTQKQIGESVQVPENIIFHWMKRYNIPTRGRFHKQIYNDLNQKLCCDCQQYKNESQFYWKQNHLNTVCKQCCSKKSMIWQQQHGEENKIKCRERYNKNKEKYKSINKQWYKKHIDERHKYNKEYYQNNKELFRKNARKWAENHRDYNRKRGKKYYHKIKHTESHKIKMKAHRDKRRRNLKFIPLFNNPFPTEIAVDYHHINNLFTIPLPTIVHNNNKGTNHREKCNQKIQNIYGLDLQYLLKS